MCTEAKGGLSEHLLQIQQYKLSRKHVLAYYVLNILVIRNPHEWDLYLHAIPEREDLTNTVPKLRH
jgi:hypothetical protein